MAAEAAANSKNEKKYAVVTGANKGLGFGVCEQLASKGIVVVLTARDEKRGLDALQKLKDSGFSDNVIFHQLDVADSTSIASFANFISTQFGKLDILVNNAGVSGIGGDVDAIRASATPGAVPNFANCSQSYESAAECLQINYYGAKRMIDAFLPLLKKSSSPRIVNVSSSLGQLTNVPDGRIKDILADADNLNDEKVDEALDEFLKVVKDDALEAKGWSKFLPAYTISKVAMNAYTRIVAKKHPDVKVNCVCPGFLRTDMNFNSGIVSIDEGAATPVRLALLSDDGPSGLFFVHNEVSSF